MQPQDIVIVRTAEQTAGSIAERMSQMRDWLDRQGIELVDFRPIALRLGSIAFEAHFREPRQADLFRAAFG